jgi:uncharacterized protein YbjT (DUF2867 family)
MKIAVIGATGMLGKPVTWQLMFAGFDVTVVARNTDAATTIFNNSNNIDQPKAKVVYGDVFNKDSLMKALQGIEGLYINLGPDQKSNEEQPQPEREGIQNILQVAKEAGIKHIIYISAIVIRYQGNKGFNWWVFNIKHAAVKAIKESGIPYTIFYPSCFMDTFSELIDRNKLMHATGSKQPNYFIASLDYGKMVVEAFKQQKLNREYDVQGPEAMNWDEAAKIVMNNYPKGLLRMMKAPLFMMKFFGRFNQKMNYAANILEAIYNYPEPFTSEAAWQELHKPGIKMKDFVQHYL